MVIIVRSNSLMGNIVDLPCGGFGMESSSDWMLGRDMELSKVSSRL